MKKSQNYNSYHQLTNRKLSFLDRRIEQRVKESYSTCYKFVPNFAKPSFKAYKKEIIECTLSELGIDNINKVTRVQGKKYKPLKNGFKKVRNQHKAENKVKELTKLKIKDKGRLKKIQGKHSNVNYKRADNKISNPKVMVLSSPQSREFNNLEITNPKFNDIYDSDNPISLLQMTKDTITSVQKVKALDCSTPRKALRAAEADFCHKADKALKSMEEMKFASDLQAIHKLQLKMASSTFEAFNAAKWLDQLKASVDLKDPQLVMKEKLQNTRKAVREEIETIGEELRDIKQSTHITKRKFLLVLQEIQGDQESVEDKIDKLCLILNDLIIKRQELNLTDNYDMEFRRIVFTLSQLFDRIVSDAHL